MLLFAVLACTPDRPLSVVGGDPGAQDTSAAVETGSPGDSGQATDPFADVQWATTACGDPSMTLPTGDDVLALDWCVRVSPEPDQVAPVVPTDPGSARCGFYNILGAISVTGTAEAPAVMYCDADTEGGMRFAWWDAGSQAMQSKLMVPGTCWADPYSGALLPVSGGYLSAFTSISPTFDSVKSRLQVMTFDATGTVTSGPTTLAVDYPWRIALVPGSPNVIVVVDENQNLSAVSVDDGGHPKGTSATLTTGVRTLTATADGAGGVLVATCSEKKTLGLLGLEADLTVGWSQTIDGVTCKFDSTPVIAAREGGFAVAWDDDAQGHVALFDGSHARTGTVDLGEAGALPDVQPLDGTHGTAWLLLASDGRVQELDATGQAVNSWRHPGTVAHHGLLDQVRAVAGPGRFGFATLGMDATDVGPHVYSYNYLEISTSSRP